MFQKYSYKPLTRCRIQIRYCNSRVSLSEITCGKPIKTLRVYIQHIYNLWPNMFCNYRNMGFLYFDLFLRESITVNLLYLGNWTEFMWNSTQGFIFVEECIQFYKYCNYQMSLNLFWSLAPNNTHTSSVCVLVCVSAWRTE